MGWCIDRNSIKKELDGQREEEMGKKQKQQQKQNLNVVVGANPIKKEDLIAFERGIIDLAKSIIQSANSARTQLDAAESCRKSWEHFAVHGGDTKEVWTMQKEAVCSAIDAASSSMEGVIATAESISKHAQLLRRVYREVLRPILEEEEYS